MKKGIVIYAIGHQNYYYMAENLAASLRSNGCKEAGISIALICDSIDKIRFVTLFDDFVLLEKEQYMVGENIVFNNATVLVYDLSPYDVTIKLDADMIWLGGRPVKSLFETLKDVDITFLNSGCGWNKGNCVWASERQIKTRYSLTDDHLLYRILGEFIYFKRNSANESFFNEVKEIYTHPKVSCHEFANGKMTDELAFQIACMTTGIYPHKEKFTPVFNQFLGYKEFEYWYPYQLPDSFYAYSIGGNAISKWIKQGYDNLAKHYFKTLGLAGPYLVSNKKSFLPERQKH